MDSDFPILYPPFGELLRTFADRIDWIIASDYEDEGASAILPLRQLKRVLRAVEAVMANPCPISLALLSFEYMRLNELR